MRKNYRLKPYDDVTNHHFISRETWDKLANCDLEVHSLRGFLSSTALICPRGEGTPSLLDCSMVDFKDLYEVTEETNVVANNTANEVVKEKTYTKDEIRSAGARALAKNEPSSVNEAVISAIAIAKLINELN